MTDREMLINEINLLPDFMIRRLLEIVHYVNIGLESEYVPETDSEFYNSREFGNIVSDSLAEHQSGRTEEMDILT